MRWVLSIDWDFFTDDQIDHAREVKSSCSWNCAPCNQRTIRADKGREDWLNLVPHVVDMIDDKVVGAELIVAECHASIYRHLKEEDIVLDLDSHVDASFFDGSMRCSNWADRACRVKCCTHEHLYPHKPDVWTLEALVGEEPNFSLVFICQSRPWTPVDKDKDFYRFVRMLAAFTGEKPRFYGNDARRLKREYESTIGKRG